MEVVLTSAICTVIGLFFGFLIGRDSERRKVKPTPHILVNGLEDFVSKEVRARLLQIFRELGDPR